MIYCILYDTPEDFLYRLKNTVAFSIRCMHLFVTSRTNSAKPRTVCLVVTVCLHLMTKASRVFFDLCTGNFFWLYYDNIVTVQYPHSTLRINAFAFCDNITGGCISVQSRKYSRGFRHEVQASCRHQAHCLRRSRVCATDGK